MASVNNGFKKTVVPSDQREGTLSKVFGPLASRVERAIYVMMDKLDASYKGGYWEFVHVESDDPETPNSFYMYPVRSELKVECRWDHNCSKESVTPETAGIVATLFALSHLSFDVNAQSLGQTYEGLLAYAMEHPEASAIASLID